MRPALDGGIRPAARDAGEPSDDWAGDVAREWIRESQSGGRNFQKLLKADLNRPIEKVGAKLRARMPWLEATR